MTKTDLEAKVGVDDKLLSLATDPLVGIVIEIEETLTKTPEIVDPTIEIDLELIKDMMTEDIPISLMKGAMITDQITGIEATTGKTVETDKIIEVMTQDRDMEIGVKVGKGPEIISVTELVIGREVETGTAKHEIDPELCQITEEVQGPGPTPE